MLGIALWMIRQTYKNEHCCAHEHHDDNHHHSEDFRIETKIGVINLSIFEEGQAAKFRLISNEISTYQIEFKEHLHDELEGLDIGSSEYQDAHLSTKYMSKKFTGFGNIVRDTPKSFATS